MESLQERYSDVGTSSFAKPHNGAFMVAGYNGQTITVNNPYEKFADVAQGATGEMRFKQHIVPIYIELTVKGIDSLSASFRRSMTHELSGLKESIRYLQGVPEFFTENASTVFKNTKVGERRIRNFTKAIDALSPEIRNKLDKNALDRIDLFENYQDGWNNGAGKKLSKASIASLEMFLRAREGKIDLASIFLTPNGNLELLWKDINGNEVELEFFPDKISSYIESSNIETDFKLNEIDSLIAKL